MSDIETSGAVPLVSPPDQMHTEHSDQSNGQSTASILVVKAIPYTFDLGHLLLNDANPVPPNSAADGLPPIARDCAQALVNQLLSACEILSTPDGVHVTLPGPLLALPREKAIPKDKEPTKWDRFAAKRGIKAKKKDGKLVYDDATAEWVPKYGYKGKNKAGESDWLVEVDGEKETRTGQPGDARKEKRAERMERIKRQDRRQRANERNSAKT